eukprot:9503787-Pyramimonas_sp.AAC.1
MSEVYNLMNPTASHLKFQRALSYCTLIDSSDGTRGAPDVHHGEGSSPPGPPGGTPSARTSRRSAPAAPDDNHNRVDSKGYGVDLKGYSVEPLLLEHHVVQRPQHLMITTTGWIVRAMLWIIRATVWILKALSGGSAAPDNHSKTRLPNNLT